jgi:hypothetical protein
MQKTSKENLKSFSQFEALKLSKAHKLKVKGGNNSSGLPTSGRLEHNIIIEDVLPKP